MKPGWLKKKSAGEYSDSSKRTVHTWIHELGLRHVKVRGTILIKREWLDEFLESYEDKGKVDRAVDAVLKDLK